MTRYRGAHTTFMLRKSITLSQKGELTELRNRKSCWSSCSSIPISNYSELSISCLSVYLFPHLSAMRKKHVRCQEAPFVFHLLVRRRANPILRSQEAASCQAMRDCTFSFHSPGSHTLR